MENRSPARLTLIEREARSPFLASVQAERERESVKGRRWLKLAVAIVVLGMAANLTVIAAFLSGWPL